MKRALCELADGTVGGGTGSVRGVMESVTEEAKSALVGTRPGIVAVYRKAASSCRWGGRVGGPLASPSQPCAIPRCPGAQVCAKKRDWSLAPGYSKQSAVLSSESCSSLHPPSAVPAPEGHGKRLARYVAVLAPHSGVAALTVQPPPQAKLCQGCLTKASVRLRAQTLAPTDYARIQALVAHSSRPSLPTHASAEHPSCIDATLGRTHHCPRHQSPSRDHS